MGTIFQLYGMHSIAPYGAFLSLQSKYLTRGHGKKEGFIWTNGFMAGQPWMLDSITVDGACHVNFPSSDKKTETLGQNMSSYNLPLAPWPSVGQRDPIVPKTAPGLEL